ncbi:MAG TPA: sugar ABC transporter permease [Beutenbergiaceae bacterium]|nr:sugar ABC transporter permease [Beutenbergiaceae bacterium]
MSWFRDVGWRHLAAVTAVLYAIFPLIYVLSASLSATGRLGDNRLFRTISLANYQELLASGNYPYLAWFTNTLVIGLTTSMITVFMGSAAAYAFSRFRFTGRRTGLASLLVIQMFPQLLAFIAIFLLLLTFRDVFPVIGLNTRLGLILVYLGGALGVNTFLMYGFFNTVPREIDEAAKIDGASHARIFLTIVLRLVAPVLAVVGLLSFVGTFSEYLIASLVLQDVPKQTLAVGLFQFISQQHSERWGMFAAGSILAAIPVVVLFQFLQRYIVAGLTSGSVKG